MSDFTAILLDVMGNSSTYLHELFKSSSIVSGMSNMSHLSQWSVSSVLTVCFLFLSVSQRNNSDCIYICVMAGKMGK